MTINSKYLIQDLLQESLNLQLSCQLKTKSKAKTKVDKTSADKENVAPVKENIVAHLYKAPSVSFTEGEDLDLFNSSLAREVD